MSFAGDPYRTLGVPPDATPEELKRAYRRLVKQFHPDSAGPAATERFIAIQVAYESLLGGAPGGAGGGSAGARSAPGQPARTAGGPVAGRSSAGARPSPGARPAPGGRPGARAGSQPGRSGRPGPEDRRAAPPSGGSERRRRSDEHVRTARPGSTTYDDADAGSRVPEWQGATWYGQSSGTYWTINPREYADPRKHGPEYQARARRAAASDATRAAGADLADAPGASASPGAATARARSAAPPPIRGWRQAEEVRSVRPPDTRAGSAGRVVTALIGWPIPGLVAALLVGEATGCGRYAAACPGPLGTAAAAASLLAQPAVIALLLGVRPLAEAAAVAALAVAGAAIPAAVLLSASGGAKAPPGQAASVLLAMLAIAYVVGFAGAAIGRLRVPTFIRGVR